MKPVFWKILTNGRWLATLGGLLLFSAACAPGSAFSTPQPPTVIEAEASPSATIVWFPATSTPTPFPTLQPSATTENFPGLGAQTYADEFNSPAAWTNAKTAATSGNAVIISANRLTLAVNTAPALLATINKELLLTDFYAETSVQINRCQGEDVYGMLFRAGSEAYAYRLALNCAGQMRVDRLRGGEVYPLAPWVPSGDVPPGAPGTVRLGVWAAGVEMRFFLNGHYQLAVIDPIFKNGSLGYFANIQDPAGANIAFENLIVRAVNYVSPTPTATPSKTPTPSRTPRSTP